MNAVQKIKAAAAKLNPDEQVELFRWWVESYVFKQRHLALLKSNIAIGVEDLEHGRYQTCNDASVMRLAEDVGRSGRERASSHICRWGGAAAPPILPIATKNAKNP
jgi:hypothetical protein